MEDHSRGAGSCGWSIGGSKRGSITLLEMQIKGNQALLCMFMLLNTDAISQTLTHLSFASSPTSCMVI